MTARAETNAAIARVLSGALQAVLAHQRTGSPEDALPAFLGEYEHDLAAAMTAGPEAVEEFWTDLTVYAITALFSVTEAAATVVGRDPADLLRELLRTYRKAGKA